MEAPQKNWKQNDQTIQHSTTEDIPKENEAITQNIFHKQCMGQLRLPAIFDL